MVYTSITIRPLLAEYFYSIFGKTDPIKHVHFPSNDYIYHAIANSVQKRPVNVSPIDVGNFTIALPNTREGKCPLTYNYISPRGVRILQKVLNRRFYADFSHFMDEHTKEHGQTATDTVEIFMLKHNICSIQHESLLKYYYRYEQRVREKIQKRAYTKSR